MFRKRDSQKPAEAFYLDFKKSYTHLAQPTNEAPATPADSSNPDTLSNTFSMSLPNSHYGNQEESNDHGLDSTDDWKLDNSLFEHDNYAFTSYWPPTPAVGSGSMFQSKDDAYSHSMSHGLSMSTGLETPLSRPVTNSDFDLRSGTLTMNDFLHSNYHPQNLFNHPHNYHGNHLQTESIHQAQKPMGTEHHPSASMHNTQYLEQDPTFQQSELPQKFRFRVTLLTATAMIKNQDEIPLTYLNKCQTYKLSIKDMAPQRIPGIATRYRTYVRISFDDEQQRERPGHCWQLWKEGRGMNEAHQRGGKLQAVEFVPPSQSQSSDRASNFELISEAFDGFCVSWTSTSTGVPECEIQVRFNFLSTDFSHSKGVKGIPVRLCAKTEVTRSSSDHELPSQEREVAYCKVKLFRDHGAERKISNDEAHVKKQVEKLTQQVGQSQSTLTDSGKRRRSDSMTGNSRPNKAAKHKRASSVSSLSSSGVRDGAEDDLHGKLATLTAMLHSRKPDSLLFLEGEDQDDPDLYPVTLQGPTQGPSSANSPEQIRLERRSTQLTGTSGASPTLSTTSIGSPQRRTSSLHCPPQPTVSRVPTNELRPVIRQATKADLSKNPQHLASPPEGPTKIQRSRTDSHGHMKEWIEALGVDESYQPPAVRTTKPIACFYVHPRVNGILPVDTHYRAIYLRQRTVKDFVEAVARKCEVDPAYVVETIHINSTGLRIKVDDEVILEMPEGQNMKAELDQAQSVKCEEAVHDTEMLDNQPMTYTLTLRY